MHDRHERRAAEQAALAERRAHSASRTAANVAASKVREAEMNLELANRVQGRHVVREFARMLKPMDGPARSRREVIDPRLMTDEALFALSKALVRIDKYDWKANGRPDQMFPEDAIIWLLCAGRGFGKTRAAVEKVREVCSKSNMRVAMIAKDHRALRDVCLEGVSGLLACIPPNEIRKIHKGLGDVSVEMMNGSVIKGYTAMEPDAVRGQAFDMVWGDEFSSWPRNRAQDMLDQARLTMRESRIGSICILSTTPKRIPHVIDLFELAKDPVERITITRGRSRDNTALNEEWHRQMERKFGGTRLGRQELEGELVLDNERALWSGRMVDEGRWDPLCSCRKDTCVCAFEIPALIGVMTGVDPSGSKDGDATGVVTCGWDRNKVIYVLENKTRNGDPGERYGAVAMSAYMHGSGEIWYESAYGGDNAAFGIQQAWKNFQANGDIPMEKKCPPLKPSTIKGDKAARAMPVVALYEQQMNIPERRRIFHDQPSVVNGLAKLEEEMLSWETDSKKSPNAIDALVHCVRQIMRRTGQDPTTFSSPASPLSTRRIPTPAARQIGGGFNPYGR